MTRKTDLKQSLIDLRRSKVLEELAQSRKVKEICSSMNVSESTIKRDISFLQKQARDNVRHYVEDTLIFEITKSLSSLDIVNRRVWDLTVTAESKRESLEAYRLLVEISRNRLDVVSSSNMLKAALNVAEKNNRTLNRLEARYKAKQPANGTATVSKQALNNAEREKVEFNESDPEAEKTTTLDTQSSEQSTHEIGDSNGP